jgi:hypothetical protein
MRTTGIADFVVTVLVPELAVVLIKEEWGQAMRRRGGSLRRVGGWGRYYAKMRHASFRAFRRESYLITKVDFL